jgi:hypothetical protein
VSQVDRPGFLPPFSRRGADDSYNDMLESELSGEVENGRLVRLMIKLGFINERAE